MRDQIRSGTERTSRHAAGNIRNSHAWPKTLSVLALSFMCGLGICHARASTYPQTDPYTRTLLVGNHHIAFYITPGRLPILVLDAWAGGDHSEWEKIVPELSRQTGSEIITYDRAGFGRSDEVKPPFRIESAVNDLETGLQALAATHDLILVPHSFAGTIATYLALSHPEWIYGAVLVDTNLPSFYTDEQTQRQYDQASPLVAALLRNRSDKQTRTLASMTDSMIGMNHAFHTISWPSSIPCIVILSETTPFSSAVDARHWKQAHLDFVRAAPNRTLVVARGSSHDVAKDRPDVIIEAVKGMVDGFRSK